MERVIALLKQRVQFQPAELNLSGLQAFNIPAKRSVIHSVLTEQHIITLSLLFAHLSVCFHLIKIITLNITTQLSPLRHKHIQTLNFTDKKQTRPVSGG